MSEYRLSDIQPNDKVVACAFKDGELYQVVSHWDNGVIIRLDEEWGWSLASRRDMGMIQEIERRAIASGIINEEEAHKRIFWYVPLDGIERVVKHQTIKWID